MKRLIFALSIFSVVFAGCSADSLTGPVDSERALEPTEACSINIQAC
ncbi:MAG TPA: hypothetical protein VJ982_08200 [Gemmatimonadota bacterium]|nr:hypothetical protein [Gemmatimonadota bacterium]HJR53684.1 hypothetical protein [Gemmatimonadota bacterium]